MHVELATELKCWISQHPRFSTSARQGVSCFGRPFESIGLIATELVMNAIKHAFLPTQSDGRIVIAYDVDGTNWKLSIADNGIGRPDGTFAQSKTGLGTGKIGRTACRER